MPTFTIPQANRQAGETEQLFDYPANFNQITLTCNLRTQELQDPSKTLELNLYEFRDGQWRFVAGVGYQGTPGNTEQPYIFVNDVNLRGLPGRAVLNLNSNMRVGATIEVLP